MEFAVLCNVLRVSQLRDDYILYHVSTFPFTSFTLLSNLIVSFIQFPNIFTFDSRARTDFVVKDAAAPKDRSTTSGLCQSVDYVNAFKADRYVRKRSHSD